MERRGHFPGIRVSELGYDRRWRQSNGKGEGLSSAAWSLILTSGEVAGPWGAGVERKVGEEVPVVLDYSPHGSAWAQLDHR